MDSFESLLHAQRDSIERFVRFRLSAKADADDCLQEIYLTAYQKFGQLKNPAAFRAWLISIARNKCNDYFRQKAARSEISLTSLEETAFADSRYGLTDKAPRDREYGLMDTVPSGGGQDTEMETVWETLDSLGDKDKQILYLYFWKELPQAEIARKLQIPLGTVKSRLHTAKQNFRNSYPYHTSFKKGESYMKKMPAILPEYEIRESCESPFSVKWEELMGWFLVPKLGERLSWGMYDMPSRKCSHIYDMAVTGKAMVHGIQGVELTAREASYSDKTDVTDRTFVAQLTDTHCRYLATLRTDGDVRNYITFLDGDAFLPNWGFGEDNCGNETNLSPKGHIRREGRNITSVQKDFLLDIVGRYTVTINGKSYDTVCVMDIETYNCGVVSEQFLDHNGRTILWRRFNRNDWAIDQYGKEWTELLPENERLTVNGKTYVQWYDCITDYIL